MHIPARIRQRLKPEQLVAALPHLKRFAYRWETDTVCVISRGEAKHQGPKDAQPQPGSPGTSDGAGVPLPNPGGWGALQDKLRCHLPFCPGFLFFPHSGRYSLLPCFYFFSASCQSSSGISRGCFLASVSLHLIRRHPHLLCFRSPAWQSNLHFTGNSWVLLNIFYLNWAARRVALNGTAAAAVAQPEPTAEGHLESLEDG